MSHALYVLQCTRTRVELVCTEGNYLTSIWIVSISLGFHITLSEYIRAGMHRSKGQSKHINLKL